MITNQITSQLVRNFPLVKNRQFCTSSPKNDMVFHTSHKTAVFDNFFKKLDDKLRSISSLSEK